MRLRRKAKTVDTAVPSRAGKVRLRKSVDPVQADRSTLAYQLQATLRTLANATSVPASFAKVVELAISENQAGIVTDRKAHVLLDYLRALSLLKAVGGAISVNNRSSMYTDRNLNDRTVESRAYLDVLATIESTELGTGVMIFNDRSAIITPEELQRSSPLSTVAVMTRAYAMVMPVLGLLSSDISQPARMELSGIPTVEVKDPLTTVVNNLRLEEQGSTQWLDGVAYASQVVLKVFGVGQEDYSNGE